MSLSELTPEDKVGIAINMTDVCVHICVDAIRDRHPTIREEELLERVRERITYVKRPRCEG